MAQNKAAIVRYRAIDKCLRKRNCVFGIEELIHACEEALYDAFSERISISPRQIKYDINFKLMFFRFFFSSFFREDIN